MEEVQALMNERHGLLAWTSVNNPVIIHKLMTSKLVDPPVPDHEPPGPVFWQRILVRHYDISFRICLQFEDQVKRTKFETMPT